LPGVKRPGREVDHSPPSKAEVKNEWSYTSISAICLNDFDRDNFTSLYASEACPLISTDQPKLRICDNRMLGKIFRLEEGKVTDISRKWPSEVCHNFPVHEILLG
jgi:hypothetical protein